MYGMPEAMLFIKHNIPLPIRAWAAKKATQYEIKRNIFT